MFDETLKQEILKREGFLHRGVSHMTRNSETYSFYSFSTFYYRKSPTYKASGCELSKMQKCICTSDHVKQFTCLAYIVTYVHSLQVVVLLCTLLCSKYCIEYSSTVPVRNRSIDFFSTSEELLRICSFRIKYFFKNYISCP